MKIRYNLFVAMIFALPIAWFIAFILSIAQQIQVLDNFLLIVFGGFFLGLLTSSFIADYLKEMVYVLIASQILLIFLGILPGFLFIIDWSSLFGNFLLFLLFFLFATSLLLFTVLLNRLVPSIRRGRVASAVTILALTVASLLLFVWQNIGGTLVRPITTVIVLGVFFVGLVVRRWGSDLQTYMVPGSIVPYLIWWIIYITAYGLYTYATPSESRILFNSLFRLGPHIQTELILLGLSLATFVFLFLPDKLGRKRVFTFASLLLGELLIFGPAHYQTEIVHLVSPILFIVEMFVAAFILSVGVWLVWAEIGPVRLKGRRALLGWGFFGGLLTAVWVMMSPGFIPLPPLIIFPVAATLVLVSLLPLMNAIQVMPNERVVEDIDISVDTRQVSRALKDLEVDTSLKRIEEQIESELGQLMKIKGVSRRHAKTLRNAGYETPALVATTNVAHLASLLSVTEEEATQILASAKVLGKEISKTGLSKEKEKPRKRAPAKKRKSQKRRKT
jgi:hypothetical protein